jgi:hypothetical protein
MLKLGKLPARPGAVSLRFKTVAPPSGLPTPPAVFGRYGEVSGWGVLGNDQFGDCVWAGAAHEHMLWTKTSGLPEASFNDIDCLADYSIVTGFAFDDATDLGTDVADAASYRRKTGVLDANGQRHLVTAYMGLAVGDFDEMLLAAYLFGSVGVGINFPLSAADQFEKGQPWDVVPGSRLEGGHYIPVVGRAANGNAIAITWGKPQEITRSFYEMYNDETVAFYCPEYTDPIFDPTALQAFLNKLPSAALT